MQSALSLLLSVPVVCFRLNVLRIRTLDVQVAVHFLCMLIGRRLHASLYAMMVFSKTVTTNAFNVHSLYVWQERTFKTARQFLTPLVPSVILHPLRLGRFNGPVAVIIRVHLNISWRISGSVKRVWSRCNALLDSKLQRVVSHRMFSVSRAPMLERVLFGLMAVNFHVNLDIL